MYSNMELKQSEKLMKEVEAAWQRAKFINGIMSGKYRSMQIKNKIRAKRAKRA